MTLTNMYSEEKDKQSTKLYSELIKRLSPSVTVGLNNKVKDLQARGQNIFNFTVGETDFSTPELIVKQAIQSLEKGNNRYTATGGTLKLRQAICTKLRRDNKLFYNPNEIVVAQGVKDVLFNFFLSVLNSDDEVIVPKPYWGSYIEQIKMANAKPICPQMPFDSPFDSSIFVNSITEKTKVITLTYPNNPLGYVPTKEEFQQLAIVLSDFKGWIVLDEIYEYLIYAQEHISLASYLPSLKERIFLVNGLSKNFSMTGWRVGFGAGSAEIVEKIKKLIGHSTTCIPGFISDASITALHGGSSLVKDQIAQLEKRRTLAQKILSDLPFSVKCFSPKGGFFFFLDIEELLNISNVYQSSYELCEALLSREFVAVVPGEAFGQEKSIRISFAVSENQLEQGLCRFVNFIQKLARM